MSELPMLPLYTDAFIADTGHLSAAQTGAYLMLLMVAWRSPGCRLPDDDTRLARWARVDARAWVKLKPTIMEFWVLEGGFWTQKRLSKEHDSARKRADTARQNGAHGGRPKPLENIDAENPAGSSRGTQPKATISISNITPVVPLRERREIAELFDAFKAAYPKRDGGQDWQTARERFARLVKSGADPQRLILSAKAYAAAEQRSVGTAYIKMAATFLSGAWKDYADEQAVADKRLPPDWPDRLPPPEVCQTAWEKGQWPGIWGAPPGNPACRIPEDILSQWSPGWSAGAGGAT